MGDRPRLRQGSAMNVVCSLNSDTAELVQAVKILASGQSPFLEGRTAFL